MNASTSSSAAFFWRTLGKTLVGSALGGIVIGAFYGASIHDPQETTLSLAALGSIAGAIAGIAIGLVVGIVLGSASANAQAKAESPMSTTTSNLPQQT
jgi:hypothetical protein